VALASDAFFEALAEFFLLALDRVWKRRTFTTGKVRRALTEPADRYQ
jgi:hypothetical protein